MLRQTILEDIRGSHMLVPLHRITGLVTAIDTDRHSCVVWSTQIP